MTPLFTGSGVAIVTPFAPSGDVDFAALTQLLDFQLDGGTDAIIICGTTGEASTLTDEEQIDVVAHTVKHVNGRIPVIAGAGSNDTRHGYALTQGLCETGIDGLLHVTPYYNKTSQAGLQAHFEQMAEAATVPIILYNVPGRTGCDLAPATVAKLARLDNVVGIKDATGSLATTIDLRAACGEDFAVYSGNDDVNIPVLAAGGVGAISVLANIAPRETAQMLRDWREGRHEQALAAQVRYQNLVHALFMEPNPIPVKAAMNLMGLPAGGYRLPMTEPSENTLKVLRQRLIEVELLEG